MVEKDLTKLCPLKGKQMQVIIVHGTTSRPERSWFPWLAWQLLRLGHEVYVPRLPTPQNQTYDSWKSAFKAQTPIVEEQTVLVGHSTGTIFLLRYLSELKPVELAGLFLVSSFDQKLTVPSRPELEPIVNAFVT